MLLRKLKDRIFPPKQGAMNATDLNIKQNVARFRDSISLEDIKKTKRPSSFREKIEIVIPCYNHANFLEQTFESIAWQSFLPKSLKVTFVNDCSKDNSLEVMKKIKKSNTDLRIRIKIINNKSNLNQAGSLNKAIASSKNELFVMLNADDLLTPDCLDLIVKTYTKNTDIFLLGGSSIWFESRDELPKHQPQPMSNLHLAKFGPADSMNFDSLNSINMSQSSCSFYKSAWELVGGYFPRNKRVCSFDDRDFQMRVCSVLPIGIYSDYPMEFYRTDSSQARATI